MRFDTARIGDVTVFTVLDSRVTSDNVTALQEEALRRVEEGERKLVLDFGAVEFVDSTGIGTVVALHNKLQDRGVFAVSALQHQVRSLFKLTRMDKVVAVYDSTEEALKALGASAHP
jgi:anti-sigma B factor antagonist